MVNRRFLPVIFLIVVLGGCSVTPEQPDVPLKQRQSLWASRNHQLQQIDHWQMIGRLGLRMGEQSGSMSVEWQQNNNDYVVYLDGPLGKSLARIERNQQGVQVEADGKRYQGQTPESLLYAITGWQLPVSYLRYWVQGRPVPGDNDNTVTLDNRGQLTQLNQAGWTIHYLDYQTVQPVSLPGRIRIEKDDIRMTLVVKHWKLQ